jgi:hypothetical protein
VSKHVSFPASHLSAFDIGNRIRAITVDGAKIEDTLTRIDTFRNSDGKVVLFLHFSTAIPLSNLHLNNSRGFHVELDQMVKRIDDED